MKHNKKGANLVGKQEKTKSGFQKLQKEEADKKNILTALNIRIYTNRTKHSNIFCGLYVQKN